MSFILDAIKKSEQDRRFSQPESMSSWYYHGTAQKATQSYFWVILVLLNTLVVAAMVLWMLQPAWLNAIIATEIATEPSVDELVVLNGTSVVASSAAPTNSMNLDDLNRTPALPASLAAATQEQVNMEQPEVVQPKSLQPEIDEVITPSSLGRDQSLNPNTYNTYNEANILDLEALPESLLIHIPAIAFSSHLFSSDPRSRQVVVNGQRLREGEYLNRDLQLLEIQEKNVIFQQSHTPFRVVLSRYWVRSE